MEVVAFRNPASALSGVWQETSDRECGIGSAFGYADVALPIGKARAILDDERHFISRLVCQLKMRRQAGCILFL